MGRRILDVAADASSIGRGHVCHSDAVGDGNVPIFGPVGRTLLDGVVSVSPLFQCGDTTTMVPALVAQHGDVFTVRGCPVGSVFATATASSTRFGQSLLLGNSGIVVSTQWE